MILGPLVRRPARSFRPLAVIVLGVVACRPPAGTDPHVPVLTAGVTAPFVARQKVVATHGDQRVAFDAVLQYDGEKLVLLGMTPMGTKAFAVVQTGDSFVVTRFVDAPLPAPAAAVLRDIHGAYFDPPREVSKDGWHRRRTAGGERLHERWAAGRLMERVWGSRHDRGATRLRFVDGLAPHGIPRQVELDHPGLDLRLEIHTLALTEGH